MKPMRLAGKQQAMKRHGSPRKAILGAMESAEGSTEARVMLVNFKESKTTRSAQSCSNQRMRRCQMTPWGRAHSVKVQRAVELLCQPLRRARKCLHPNQTSAHKTSKKSLLFLKGMQSDTGGGPGCELCQGPALMPTGRTRLV